MSTPEEQSSDQSSEQTKHIYAVEHATACHEAVMARIKAIIPILINTSEPGNVHLAKAVKTIIEEDFHRLEQTIQALEDSSASYYAALGPREVSQANKQRADELAEMTERYFEHMETRFPSNTNFSARSVRLTMFLFPVVNRAAVQQLAAELFGREPQDPTYRAYRDAMLEATDLIPHTKRGIQMAQAEARRSPEAQQWQDAMAAVEAIETLTAPHR